MGQDYNSKEVSEHQDDQGMQMAEVSQVQKSSKLHPHYCISIITTSSHQPKYASPHLLDDNREARQKYQDLGVPLYKAGIKGDWEKAKHIIDENPTILNVCITKGGLTVLHLAAGARNVNFVEQLTKMMSKEDLELQDGKGNTALAFAAAAGNVQVAEVLMRKNVNLVTIRGGKGTTPLYVAALFGHSEMAHYLYLRTNDLLEPKDRTGIFFTCINTGIYDLALEMLEDDTSLATARDKDNKTALHLFARMPSAFAKQSSTLPGKLINSCLNFRCKKNLKKSVALQLVQSLWKKILYLPDDDIMTLIGHPTELLFDAAKVGNFEFLAELINSYPDLIWETDSANRSIIHVAVLYRHPSIFNLIHDIGSIKDLLATYTDSENNNILHLAAKLPPPNRLNIVSGAAFQMQQELLWFEEVKKIVQPHYIEMENKKGKTPQELFTSEHKGLLRKGEHWMRSTANSCLIISTLITAIMFAAAFSVPKGNNDPNRTTSFLIFALSDGLALFSSSTSIIMFLSILISKYEEGDFLKSLPLRLMIGLTCLFVSITAMVIAFSFTFLTLHHFELKWVSTFIFVAPFVPISLLAFFVFPPLFDILSSITCSRSLFKVDRHMID
ncbi:hypothetical protein UlMin_019184 [Ulmus minor]